MSTSPGPTRRGRRSAPRRPAERAAVGRPPEPLGRPVSTAGLALTILRAELLAILRDRRALVAGVLLPVLLYPLVFMGQDWLQAAAQETLVSTEVEVVLALDEAPDELAAAIRRSLVEAGPARLVEADPERLRELRAARGAPGEPPGTTEREAARALLEARGARGARRANGERAAGSDALLVAERAEVVRFWLFTDRATDRGNTARERVRGALGELERAGRTELLEEHFGGDPAAALELETRDVASDVDRGGMALGKLLPILAVFVVLSGASFAALSSFAGERESGTLEALLVQPVPYVAIGAGKLAAVCLVGALTLVLNVASVLASLAAGLGELPGTGDAAAGALSVGLPRLLAAALILLPAVVLLSAALSLVAARARSFREGQHQVLPLILACVVPVVLGTQGDLELDLLLAVVPLTGATMAMRDALAGDLVPWLGAAAFLSHVFWAGLVASRVAPRLDAERLLSSRDLAEEAGRRRLASRSALRFGFGAVLGLYLVGGFLQARSPVWGLAATLWLLLLPLALVAAARIGRHTGEGLVRSLGLRRPAPAHLLGALLLAPGLGRAMAHYLGWQMEVLPLPSGPAESFFPSELLDLGLLAKVLLLAVTPAVCEELFFRGPLLSGLRRDLRPARCVAWQALLFGLAHASIHRLLPTAMLGALLAAVMLRSRSLWVVVLLHGAYNAWLVTAEANPWFDGWAVPWLAALGALLLALPAQRSARER